MTQHFDIIIAGGGAAGFFTAINTAEQCPNLKIAILERGKEVLTKVRISGGGRCNVTHACFEPNELVKFYPRGEKELKGPFHQFCSGDTITWFKKRGVTLKTEEDGRMFPISDTSQTIIDCFISETIRLNIAILTGQSIQQIEKREEVWHLTTQDTTYTAQKLLLATGSNPKIWKLIKELGHGIIKPVPSLFTFTIDDPRIKNLPGVATPATIQVKDNKLAAVGPLLITHWGMSGPAILKLSAWGARLLAEKNYDFTIVVNWLKDKKGEEVSALLKSIKEEQPKKTIGKNAPFAIPNRLWEALVLAAGITSDLKWADLPKAQMQNLVLELTQAQFRVHGKSTFKDEFVTAGGIDLKEIDFKTMQSKLHKNLYFAGEIVNVDAITGGFNFQHAWTSGFIAAAALCKN